MGKTSFIAHYCLGFGILDVVSLKSPEGEIQTQTGVVGAFSTSIPTIALVLSLFSSLGGGGGGGFSDIVPYQYMLLELVVRPHHPPHHLRVSFFLSTPLKLNLTAPPFPQPCRGTAIDTLMSELETLERRGSPPPSALTEDNLNTLSPAHEEAARASDKESVLSDTDEEVFREFDDSLIERIVPIDEETVHTIGKYKKKLDPSQLGEKPGKKERRRRDIKRRDDGEERIGEPEPQEQELTAEESEWW